MSNYDIAVIGGGIAGLTAAIYARRANCSVVVIEKQYCGGQLVPLNEIGNYPGFESINGYDLSEKVRKQAEKLGTEFLYTQVSKVSLVGALKIITTAKTEIIAKSVIIANGTTRKLLGCKGEREFSGKGVSYCATCDGSLYKGKKVAIAGSAFATLEDCLYLSNICDEVYLINPKGEFEDKEFYAEVVEKPNVKSYLGAKPLEVGGQMKVDYFGIELSGEKIKLDIDALFVVNGTVADNSFFAPLEINAQGFFVAGEDCRSNVEGVFVAGDTRNKSLRQAVTAASDGAVAGVGASLYAKRHRN